MRPDDPADVLVGLLAQSALAGRLDPAELRALEAIVTAPLSWSPVSRIDCKDERAETCKTLARARIPKREAFAWLAGLEARGVSLDVLADLEAAGLVTTWDAGGAVPAVTLTPLAAEAIGVELVEFGSVDDPLSRWLARDATRPTFTQQRAGRCVGVPAMRMALLVDQGADPVAEAIVNELAATKPWLAAPAVVDPWNDNPLVVLGQELRRDHRRAKAKAKAKARGPRKRKAGAPAAGVVIPFQVTRPDSFDLDALRLAVGG